MDLKKSGGLAGLILAAHLSGHAVRAQLAPSVSLTARPIKMRIDPKTGALGLDIMGTAGTRAGIDTLNWDADGSAPLVNGRPTTDAHAKKMGDAFAVCARVLIDEANLMASDLAQPMK